MLTETRGFVERCDELGQHHKLNNGSASFRKTGYDTGNIHSDLLCFSHLRWHFVTQRPQHLLTRCAYDRRVFFWEEPYWDADDNGDGMPTLEVMHEQPNLWVLRPHLPRIGCADAMQTLLLSDFMEQQNITRYVRWYYTPMALSFTHNLEADATVYDCMDELSGFLGAPPQMHEWEKKLLAAADVVFTGGMSLYEAKCKQHSNVHALPSSIDVAHFASARTIQPDPEDQTAIPHPRVGFFGVLDERLDICLLRDLAALRPEIHFVLIGPVVKVDPTKLPVAANLHYLGGKSYAELPRYLAGWDATMIPFARNESTRFISPTKTPEYLAAGKPVVSTPIRDVISGYGDAGLVAIASTPQGFAAAIDQALKSQTAEWRQAVEEKLSNSSWDRTWAAMWEHIEQARTRAKQLLFEKATAFRIARLTVTPSFARTPNAFHIEPTISSSLARALTGGIRAEGLAVISPPQRMTIHDSPDQ